MRSIRGLPRGRQLWALCLGAAILPVALAGIGEVAVWTACAYWMASVAAVTSGSVVVTYLVRKDRSEDGDRHGAA